LSADGQTKSWSATHTIWPFIEQLENKGMRRDAACWLVRNWLNAGWILPSVIAQELHNENKTIQEEMAEFKKTMANMQEWYDKLDDFLKEREKLKNELTNKKGNGIELPTRIG
jgi:hypothetical protein